MAKARAKAKQVRAQPTAFARNAELEAKLIADPDDAETRAVFADWLQAQGDPWGELIALEDAGKASRAKKLRLAATESLAQGVPPRAFTWQRGFVDILRLTGALANTELASALDIRTLVLARGLYLARVLDADDVRIVSERAPRRLVKLFTWLGDPLGELAHPTVRRMQVYVPAKIVPTAAAFAPLFSGERTPQLRHLEIYDSPLPREWLAALLDSKLMRQLVGFELYQGALDEAFILERKAQLAHLEYVNFRDQRTPALDTVFAKQLAARTKADLDDIE